MLQKTLFYFSSEFLNFKSKLCKCSLILLHFFSDNMKDSIVAKLASQCEELYAECLKTFQRENLKHMWDKDWIPMVSLRKSNSSKLIKNYKIHAIFNNNTIYDLIIFSILF